MTSMMQLRRAMVVNLEVINKVGKCLRKCVGSCALWLCLFTKDVLGSVEGRFLDRIERAKAGGIDFI